MSGGLVIAWPAWTKSASTPGPLAARALASCPKHLGGFDASAEADDAIPSIRASATQIVSVSRFRRNHPLRLADDRMYPLMTQGCSTSMLYRGFRGHTPPCAANARRRARGRLGHYRATSTAASGRPFLVEHGDVQAVSESGRRVSNPRPSAWEAERETRSRGSSWGDATRMRPAPRNWLQTAQPINFRTCSNERPSECV
jgi:hypothetical protein